MKSPFLPNFFCSAALLALAVFSATAQAQSSCSSDDQRAPTAVLERFISADCDACWAMSTLPAVAKDQASLDWIVPSPLGDEAALSTAATRDALARLQELKLPWTAAQATLQTSTVLSGPRDKPASTLRVAHGLPVSGYIGVSIEFTPNAALRREALTPKKLSSPYDAREVVAYLVLIETLPAGAEGSNVERNLVRNVLVTPWNLSEQLARAPQDGFKPLFESRPISIPPGVNPDRLRVLGWIEATKLETKGLPSLQTRVLAMAQSRCVP